MMRCGDEETQRGYGDGMRRCGDGEIMRCCDVAMMRGREKEMRR